MSITDFGNRSKDEIIEYLIDEHNATERETAQLRQELAEAKETIEEFKRMIFASRSEKKHVGYDNPEQLTLMDFSTKRSWQRIRTLKSLQWRPSSRATSASRKVRKRRRRLIRSCMTSFHRETFCVILIRMRRSAHNAATPWSVSAGRKSVPNWRSFRLRSAS